MDSPTDQERPFRICPACRAMTPSNIPRCVECGEMSVQALAEQNERESERRFARALFSRRIAATWALIGANVAVFVLMASVAGTWNEGSPAYMKALINFGAKLNPLIDLGEYWRLITPIFIHIGVFHLLVNMYSLYILGQYVERLYGTARYILIYLLSGIAGVCGSYALMPTGGPSAGASGAIFGLLGVVFVFGIRYRKELPGGFRRAFSPFQILPILVLNLFITFAIPLIDKGAHLGGLAVGVLLGAVIPYARAHERRARTAWRIAAFVCVLAMCGAFAFAFASPQRSIKEIERLLGATLPPDTKGTDDVRATPAGRFVTAYNESLKALRDVLVEIDGSGSDEPSIAKLRVRALSAAALARQTVALDVESRALLDRRAELIERGVRLLSEPVRDRSAQEVADLGAEFSELETEWSSWLERNGDTFGIFLNNTDVNGGDDGD